MSENAGRTQSALDGALAVLRSGSAAAASWLRQPDLAGGLRGMRANPRRAIVPGAGLLLVALAGSWMVSRSQTTGLVAAAQKGPFEVKIVEGGTLQALRSVTYSSSIPGS